MTTSANRNLNVHGLQSSYHPKARFLSNKFSMFLLMITALSLSFWVIFPRIDFFCKSLV